MSRLRQVLGGILVALISLSIVGGGISLAFQEAGVELAQFAPSAPPVPTQPNEPPEPSQELPPQAESPAGTITATPLLVIEDGGCPPPDGWQTIRVKPGETIPELAARYQIEPDLLKESNCLEVDELRGGLLNVPPVPSPTPTPTRTPTPIVTRDPNVCGPPPDWVLYTVKPNDNLFRLSIRYNVSVEDLRWANCLGTSNLINTGQELYVPPTPISETESTGNPTSIVPSSTPSPTPLPSATPTASPTLTTPTLTATLAATASSTPSLTPTPTDTPRPSPTPEPSATPTSTATASPTATPTPSSTGTATPGAPTATVPTGGIRE